MQRRNRAIMHPLQPCTVAGGTAVRVQPATQRVAPHNCYPRVSGANLKYIIHRQIRMPLAVACEWRVGVPLSCRRQHTASDARCMIHGVHTVHGAPMLRTSAPGLGPPPATWGWTGAGQLRAALLRADGREGTRVLTAGWAGGRGVLEYSRRGRCARRWCGRTARSRPPHCRS